VNACCIAAPRDDALLKESRQTLSRLDQSSAVPNITRNNHYVPEATLKRWSIDGQRIWGYRLLVSHRGVRSSRQELISRLTRQTDFYTEHPPARFVLTSSTEAVFVPVPFCWTARSRAERLDACHHAAAGHRLGHDPADRQALADCDGIFGLRRERMVSTSSSGGVRHMNSTGI
jgi:hypothetical protein